MASPDGITGDFLKTQLRPGNVYTSNGVIDFVEPLIKHYNEKFPETTPFLRGDSGFAVPALYDLCESEFVYYVIRLKSNAVLQRMANELHPAIEVSDVTRSEHYYEEIEYQAKSWSRARKVIVQSVRLAGELFFTHSFFVTNLESAFTPEAIVCSYQKRGTMENNKIRNSVLSKLSVWNYEEFRHIFVALTNPLKPKDISI